MLKFLKMTFPKMNFSRVFKRTSANFLRLESVQTCEELVESLKFCNTECSLEEAGFDTAENEPPEVSAKFKNPGIRGGVKRGTPRSATALASAPTGTRATASPPTTSAARTASAARTPTAPRSNLSEMAPTPPVRRRQ